MKTAHRFFLLIVLAVLALPYAALAQTVASNPAVAPASIDVSGIVAILTPGFSLVITYWLKKAAPHIPGFLWPLISAICGLIPDLLAHYVTGSASNPTLGLLLGLSATGLHQISAQLKPDNPDLATSAPAVAAVPTAGPLPTTTSQS